MERLTLVVPAGDTAPVEDGRAVTGAVAAAGRAAGAAGATGRAAAGWGTGATGLTAKNRCGRNAVLTKLPNKLGVLPGAPVFTTGTLAELLRAFAELAKTAPNALSKLPNALFKPVLVCCVVNATRHARTRICSNYRSQTMYLNCEVEGGNRKITVAFIVDSFRRFFLLLSTLTFPVQVSQPNGARVCFLKSFIAAQIQGVPPSSSTVWILVHRWLTLTEAADCVRIKGFSEKALRHLTNRTGNYFFVSRYYAEY